MYQTKNLGLNITEIEKDSLSAFNFDTDLGHNFKAIDEKTLSHRNITNCLLEVPQDIKLELVDGVITLKAGSKFYIPNGLDDNGNKLFITKTLNNDARIEEHGTGKFLLYIHPTGGLETSFLTGATVTDYPEDPISYALYYNSLTNNIMVYYTNSWVTDCSFPIAIVTRSESGFTSIDQVFNGFGYIGSTVFALPGVKGLIPNGRNEDGSLNNIIITLDSVKTHTTNFHFNLQNTFWLRSYGDITQGRIDYWTTGSHITTPVIEDGYLYDPNTNRYYYGAIGSTEWQEDMSYIALAQGYVEADGKISSFTPKKPFKAVDYSDYSTKIAELEAKIEALQAAVEALQGS